MQTNNHSKYNTLAVIVIVGLVVIGGMANLILAPYFHITPDSDTKSFITNGMIGLLALLAPSPVQQQQPAGTASDPVKTVIQNSEQNPVETHEAGTP